MNKDLKFVYFGGEPLGVPVLEELQAAGYLPSLVVASPDRKSGRGQKLTPPPVKVWAVQHDIPVIQPESFPLTKPSDSSPRVTLGLEKQEEAGESFSEQFATLTAVAADLFIVVAYNHLLPEWLITLPKYKCLNVHPSLLPLLRGASPIRSAILKDMREEIGVSVMALDKKMDHGPIVTQKKLEIAPENWPIKGPELDEALARLGGSLLAATLPGYCSGELTPQEQEHEYATYCGRFEKSDGELSLDPHNLPSGSEAYQMLLKIFALMGGPGTFFVHEGNRIKIMDATIENSQLQPLQITPEGKPPQSFNAWLQNQN